MPPAFSYYSLHSHRFPYRKTVLHRILAQILIHCNRSRYHARGRGVRLCQNRCRIQNPCNGDSCRYSGSSHSQTGYNNRKIVKLSMRSYAIASSPFSHKLFYAKGEHLLLGIISSGYAYGYNGMCTLRLYWPAYGAGILTSS